MGESLQDAALRETHEEAGVAITLTGVLSIEYSASRDGHARMRAIFLAEPVDPDAVPKTLPDYESAGMIVRAHDRCCA